MSISSALVAAQQKVANAYSSVSTKGGTLPATQNLSNLPSAIESIPSGGGGSKYGCNINNVLGGVDANGVLQPPLNTSGDIVFNGVKDVKTYALYAKFYQNKNLTHGISFPDLEELTENYSCQYICGFCSKLTSIYFPKLTTISGTYSLGHAFQSCTSLTSVSFPKLTTITGTNGCYYLFGSCTNLTSASFPELTTISSNTSCMYNAFYNTSIQSISFPKLAVISGQTAFGSSFGTCRVLTSVSFPALTTSSFGSVLNQFSSMFNSSTAATSGTCTVHFPSNLQSTISGLTGYPSFGGTASRIVLAFDLPATA